MTDTSDTEVKLVPASAETKTAQYVAVNDAEKNLTIAMADMRIFEQQHVGVDGVWDRQIRAKDSIPKWCVVDGNWDARTLHHWLKKARESRVATAFEPVSVEKAARLLSTPSLLPGQIPHVVDIATPNEWELAAMHDAARSSGLTERADWWQTIDALGIPSSGARSELVSVTSQRLVDDGIPQRAIQLLPFVPCVLTKLGARGVLLTRILREDDEALRSATDAPHVVARTKTGEGGIGGLYMRLFPPAEVLGEGDVVSVNGAGDTFLGALVARLSKMESPRVEDAIEYAQRASVLTLRSAEAVSPDLASLR